MLGVRIAAPGSWWWREVQHRIGEAMQFLQRTAATQITSNAVDASTLWQCCTPNERDNPLTPRGSQFVRDASAKVAKTDDQNFPYFCIHYLPV